MRVNWTNTSIVIGISVMLLLHSKPMYGQDEEQVKPKKIGFFIGLGADSYKGDLSGYEKWTNSFRIGIKFNRFKRANGNIMLASGTLIGQDPFYTFTSEDGSASSPNTFVKTAYTSLNYEFQYNLVDHEKWKVFLGQGIGFFFFTPKDEFDNALFDQLSTRSINEEYGKVSAILPTSLGVRYMLKEKVGIEGKATLLNITTDYIDNISEWGNKNGNDNALSLQLLLFIPL